MVAARMVGWTGTAAGCSRVNAGPKPEWDQRAAMSTEKRQTSDAELPALKLEEKPAGRWQL